jgi:hypothetical protein
MNVFLPFFVILLYVNQVAAVRRRSIVVPRSMHDGGWYILHSLSTNTDTALLNHIYLGFF